MQPTLTGLFGGLALALAFMRLIAHWRALRRPGSLSGPPLCGLLAFLACGATLVYASRIGADRILLAAAWVNLASSVLAFAQWCRPIDTLTCSTGKGDIPASVRARQSSRTRRTTDAQ